MTSAETFAIVLAAGMGTRMRSQTPKVMHQIAGRPAVDHVLAGLNDAGVTQSVVVIGPELESQSGRFAPHPTAVQRDRLGTGHAVKIALDETDISSNTVLIVYGDTPLLTSATIQRLVELQRSGAGICLLAFRPKNPAAYGRLIVEGDQVDRIVEAADASPEELLVTLCNSGVMAVSGDKLATWVRSLKNDNAKKEYYLTDIVALARADGASCSFVEGSEDELAGINTRADLAEAERILQVRYRTAAMEGGVTLRDPESVYLSFDTEFGTDIEVGPFTVFGPGVSVADNVIIKGFCHFENAVIGRGAVVGPYARLRPGAAVDAEAHIGNFVEIKNARIEEGAKVNHLTYIGDARVGKGANVGAGTITANYDGFNKSFTDIGENASIGSNSVLVAPVAIGDGAITGAGAVVRKDVPADAIAITVAPQDNRENTAKRYKEARATLAAKKKAAPKNTDKGS